LVFVLEIAKKYDFLAQYEEKQKNDPRGMSCLHLNVFFLEIKKIKIDIKFLSLEIGSLMRHLATEAILNF
jgi:hypothetical protein